MTRRELIELCLSYPGSYEDYPFDDDTNAGAGSSGTSWTVMRHRGNKKSFAFIFIRLPFRLLLRGDILPPQGREGDPHLQQDG